VIFETEKAQGARFRDGVLPSGEGELGEREGHESYLWIGLVETEVAGGGPAAVGLGHGGDVPACWGSKRLGEVVQGLPRGEVVQALGWGRGAPVGSGEAQQGVEESGEGLMMAAHGEQGRRRPWQQVVLFEEAEEGRKEEEGKSKRATDDTCSRT
jgi:hypothetical protein